MRFATVRNLVLFGLPLGQASRRDLAPDCASDCAMAVGSTSDLDDLALLCNMLPAQQSLFRCLAGVCQPQAYSLALAYTIGQCAEANASISTLHPVEIQRMAYERRHVAESASEMEMADSSSLFMSLEQPFAMALDCHAGVDGTVTISIPEVDSSETSGPATYGGSSADKGSPGDDTTTSPGDPGSTEDNTQGSGTSPPCNDFECDCDDGSSNSMSIGDHPNTQTPFPNDSSSSPPSPSHREDDGVTEYPSNNNPTASNDSPQSQLPVSEEATATDSNQPGQQSGIAGGDPSDCNTKDPADTGIDPSSTSDGNADCTLGAIDPRCQGQSGGSTASGPGSGESGSGPVAGHTQSAESNNPTPNPSKVMTTEGPLDDGDESISTTSQAGVPGSHDDSYATATFPPDTGGAAPEPSQGQSSVSNPAATPSAGDQTQGHQTASGTINSSGQAHSGSAATESPVGAGSPSQTKPFCSTASPGQACIEGHTDAPSGDASNSSPTQPFCSTASPGQPCIDDSAGASTDGSSTSSSTLPFCSTVPDGQPCVDGDGDTSQVGPANGSPTAPFCSTASPGQFCIDGDEFPSAGTQSSDGEPARTSGPTDQGTGQAGGNVGDPSDLATRSDQIGGLPTGQVATATDSTMFPVGSATVPLPAQTGDGASLSAAATETALPPGTDPNAPCVIPVAVTTQQVYGASQIVTMVTTSWQQLAGLSAAHPACGSARASAATNASPGSDGAGAAPDGQTDGAGAPAITASTFDIPGNMATTGLPAPVLVTAFSQKLLPPLMVAIACGAASVGILTT